MPHSLLLFNTFCIKNWALEQNVDPKRKIARPKLNITQKDGKFVLAPWFKTYYFEYILWDVVLVRFVVDKAFSASLWDQCQSEIMRNLGSY